MYKFLVFAGTTEGREIVKYLSLKNVSLHVCVATEYGDTLIEKNDNIKVSSERLNQSQMEELIKNEGFDLVIDTTHPYAVEVSVNILNACKNTKTQYLRLIRDSEKIALNENLVYVNSVEEAVDYLKNTTGNALITTGSKELAKYTVLKDYNNRLYSRVLSTPKVVEECSKLGFQGEHLICMQGPFSEELNYAILKQISAEYLVTKESGKAGGFSEKISAANKANVITIVIGRPEENEGYSYSEVVKILQERFDIKSNRKVYLIGIGMGSPESMTIEAEKAFESSGVIIGAKRMVEGLDYFNKPKFASYKYDEIVEFIEEHREYETIAVAYSGDVGFYSGAKKLVKRLDNYDIEMNCGISSVVYFCSKLKTSWDDAKLLSIHGKEENIIDAVIYNEKTFSLLGGKESVQNICKDLVEYGLGDVSVAVGENLSYPNERIHKGLAKNFTNSIFEDLSVILITNLEFKTRKAYYNISDEEFIRGEVPMTKSEVRSLSISKLELEEESIVYDVGAGTGSVAIEISLNVKKGKVFGIEKNPKGIELININKKKFKAANLQVIEGLAPDAMEDLPAPTHVFIGGSSGNLKEIIRNLLDKNPKVKIVINAITLETLGEALECIKEFQLADVDITQALISKGRQLGKYNLMTGQNPIYIISFKGGGNYE